MKKLKFPLLFLLFLVGCNRPIAASPTSDLFATLQASTPSGLSTPLVTQPDATALFDSPTQSAPLLHVTGIAGPVGGSGSQPSNTSAPAINSTPANPTPAGPSGRGSTQFPSASDQLTGHIVFTCQLFKVQAMDQICIMSADGSGMRRLTTDDQRRHFYPSLAPDGQSVLYSSFREQNVYEIYSLDLNDDSVERLTDRLGVLNAPEVSPDGNSITFARGDPQAGTYQIMVMDRNGDNARNIPQVSGWDPTWSPDGNQILFASEHESGVQLFVVDRDGKGLHQVSNLPAIRGRSDWSPDGGSIATYSGPSWNREIYVMNADGSNARQLTPAGGNSQGPSFSPDGNWVAFTAYFDNYREDHGCEIYVIRTDGTDLRRLTNNDYCDYQPRWGP
jgi:Tol biopolymer transport system component